MTIELPESESYWLVSAPAPAPAPAPELTDVDVAVLGGGIAGITTAYLLREAGRTVALIEARELLEGVTGHTTAKVSAQHGLIYTDLKQRFDDDAARRYGLSQLTALEWIRAEAVRLGVDCEWSDRDSFVYGNDSDQLREEASVAASLGLPASYMDTVDLPYPVGGAVRFARQAQFHPVRWLRSLAARIPGDGSYIAEGVRALDVRTGNGGGAHEVQTEAGTLRAQHVVVATHYPVLDRGFFFARLEPVRELVVAGPMPAATAPRHMYLGVDDGYSVRTTPYHNGDVLAIVLGEHYRPGTESDVEDRHAALAEWATSSLGLPRISYRWSAQDNTTVDRLPYIGRYSRRHDRLWVATGFGQWGMTNGTLAGLVLRDLITGRDSEWSDLYDPARVTVRASAAGFVKDNAAVAEHFVADRLRAVGAKRPADLSPGEAVVTTVGTRLAAVRRDPSGVLVALSGRCTHLGCAVAFNDDEQSWDCPCHGSRFGLDGAVIEGPATAPLAPLDVDAD